MAIRSITKAIVVPANGEQLADVISGIEGAKRVIKWLTFERTANYDVVGYIDQVQFVSAHSNDAQFVDWPLPVDAELAVGQLFQVGFLDRSGSGATKDLTVFYEETTG